MVLLLLSAVLFAPDRWLKATPVDEMMSVFRNLQHKEWRFQPSSTDKDRDAPKFVRCRDPGAWPWRYVIYRTVYTPALDEVWDRALEETDMIARYSVDAEGRAESWGCDLEHDGILEKIACETYKNVVIKNKARWDGASLDDVHEHFKLYIAERMGGMIHHSISPHYTVCLVINEESLEALVDAADDGEAATGFVDIVDPWYQAGEYCDTTYRGVDVGGCRGFVGDGGAVEDLFTGRGS